MRSHATMIYAVAAISVNGLLGTLSKANDAPEKVATFDEWSIYRSVDSMTDVANCLALYQDRWDVQLTTTSIAFNLRKRGGVQAYKYRLDNGPATSLKLATDIERQIDAVVLDGIDYYSVLGSRRLRFQAMTILNTTVDEDIDLTNAKRTVEAMAAPECKGGN